MTTIQSKKKKKYSKKKFTLKKEKLSRIVLFNKSTSIDLISPKTFQVSFSENLSPEENKQSIIFRGDSGKFIQNSWIFKDEDTRYRLDPKNFMFTPIYLNFLRFYWNGQQLFDTNNQIQNECPSWFLELLPQDCKLDLYIYLQSNQDWLHSQVYLFDIISVSEILKSRLKQLEFILENIQLQWKITKLPDNLVSSLEIECPIKICPYQSITNIRQAYLLYKDALRNNAKYVLLRSPEGYCNKQDNNLLKWSPN